MGRLIDEQTAYDILTDYYHHSTDAQHAALKEALGRVDAVPVKHGRWIPVDSYSAFGGDESTWMSHGNPIAFYYCSECKEQAYAGEDGESLLTKYCPDCGARMDGKDGDYAEGSIQEERS